MADQDARDVMQGYLSALRDHGDFGRYFAEDVRWTTMESGDEMVGRDVVTDFIVAFHTVAFEARPETMNVVTGDDTAILEFRFVGKHIGDFAGIPATGAKVDLPYCVAYDIANGQISALRAYMPVTALRAQLAEKAGADRPTAPV